MAKSSKTNNKEEVNTAVQVQNKNKQVQQVIDASVVSDIPVELANNLMLVARRLTAFLSYYSAASLNRLNTLSKFIAEAEDRLYNVDVQKMDVKELNARYKEAKRAQAEIMTIASQVSKQAVDTDNTARIDEVYSLLKSMSSSTLQQLQEALISEEDDE